MSNSYANKTALEIIRERGEENTTIAKHARVMHFGMNMSGCKFTRVSKTGQTTWEGELDMLDGKDLVPVTIIIG